VDYPERLRRLAINDDVLTTDDLHESVLGQLSLDAKTLALARVAALVAMGASEPSFGSQVDAAISAGATSSEIVDTLVGVIAVVGVPRAVAAAPKVALALGHDVYDEDTGRIAATGQA
jgi:alkylhydroperoxidase/carboxymuconolactone decarboxylase family protein YurZ